MNTDGPGELILVSIPRTLPFGDVFSLAEDAPLVGVLPLVPPNDFKCQASLRKFVLLTALGANLAVFVVENSDLPNYFLILNTVLGICWYQDSNRAVMRRAGVKMNVQLRHFKIELLKAIFGAIEDQYTLTSIYALVKEFVSPI
jgi:hypothetical protein